MPFRTRQEMHIGLDLILNTLNSTPSNRMDPAIKDFFLNMIISKFVKNVVDGANTPDEKKRVPFRILTYGDILNKYNDIYTLIVVDDTITPDEENTEYNLYTLPEDLFRFETSYSSVKSKTCSTSYFVQIPNPLLSTYDVIGFNNNPFGGKRKYIATILTGEGLRLYHLDRYIINKIGIIYLKNPAILTSSPTVVNCDLPASVHDNIIEDTARFISAAVANGSYQQLVMESKK